MNIDQNIKFTEEEAGRFKSTSTFCQGLLLLVCYSVIWSDTFAAGRRIRLYKEYENLAYSRIHYDECADFIASEMKQAARDLPLRRGANNVARPTRGAALAARAKVLLYAASPINNPRPGDTENSQIGRS